MFYVFDHNLIRLTRGNSVSIEMALIVESTGDMYEFTDDDRVVFTVAKNTTGAVVLRKTMTIDDVVDTGKIKMELKPDETVGLAPGEYKYDCLLITADGQAITFISSAFMVDEAVGVYTDIGGAVDG